MGQNIGIGICLVVGGLMFLFAVKGFIETLIFLRASRKTYALVVRLAKTRNSDRQTMYLPVLEFQSAGERKISVTSTIASNPPAYKIGEQVEIRYLTKNPQSAKINSFSEIWLITIFLTIFATACFALALVIFFAK